MKVEQFSICVNKLLSPSGDIIIDHKSDVLRVSYAEVEDFQELPSPFLVLSTTMLTMTGIRHIGVITRTKTMSGGGSLSSSVGQSLKKLV